MGKAVFDGSDRELALHMELRLKTPGRKEVAIDPAEPKSQDIDEEAGATVATNHAKSEPVRPQESGLEESVQRGKRFLWILFRKKMTALNRFELHVYAFVLPGRLNVEERRRRW